MKEQYIFCPFALHVFYISNTFTSNTKQIGKNLAKAKQHSDAELLLFKNH